MEAARINITGGIKPFKDNDSSDVAKSSSKQVHDANSHFNASDNELCKNKKQTALSGQGEPRLVIPKIVVTMAPDDESCVEQTSLPSSPIEFRKKSSDEIETVIDHDYRYSHYLLDVPQEAKVSRKHMIGSEQEITESELILAATLVHDAMEGRNAKFKTERNCVAAYRLYKKWQLTLLLYLAILINLSLVIFEEPAVESLALDYPVTLPIEVVCLLYFVFRTSHQFYWRSRQQFLRDIKNVIVIIIIVITFIDMFVYAVMKTVAPDATHVRVSRPLRAVIIVNLSDSRQIRRAWRNMRRTFKETIHVVVLFFFFIFVFALIAFKIFHVRQDITFHNKKPYFKNYMDSVWEMYVLVTTSNNPDVILPAFKESRFYCIFFSVYIFVCFYIFLNVFLAVAYHSFNANIMVEIKCSIDAKKGKLRQAFEVIKINKNGHDMVTYKTWKRLMNLVLPKLSKNQIDLLMLVLNTKCSGYIDRSEFMHVADLLNVPISQVNDRITWLEKTFPSVYLSFPSQRIKEVVQTIYFKSVYDLVVIIEVFLIGFDVPGIDIPFCVLFYLEIGLKVYTYGPFKYFKRPRNWFDVIITVLCSMFLVLDTVIQSDHYNENIFKETTQAFNIIRIFRILRLLFRIKRFKTIINTLMNVSLSILVYCVIVFIFVYIFNVIGMELFKGRIQSEINKPENKSENLFCGTKELENSEFASASYCDLNFNDFISSTFVLATMLFENNWHIIADGFVLVTNKWSRMYFALFYMFVTVITINIITAFVLDMFLYEYRMQLEDKKDSTIEKKIKELGLGIDEETGMEISQPLSDEQLKEWMMKHDITAPDVQPWNANASLKQFPGIKHVDVDMTNSRSYLQQRQSTYPALNKYDGIRFHIKKRGWTKVEVLLQQLYESENDNSPVNDTESNLAVRVSNV